MAGVIAGSIVGGWTMEQRGGGGGGGEGEGEGGSGSNAAPFGDRSELEGREGVEIHPGTRGDDAVIGEGVGKGAEAEAEGGEVPSQQTTPCKTPTFGPQLTPSDAEWGSSRRGV